MKLDEGSVKALLERVLGFVGSSGAEVILSGGNATVLRFANNQFHQNVRENRLQLYIRIVEGLRMGATTVDDFSDASLRASVARAKDILKNSDEAPDMLPLLRNQNYQPSPGRYDDRIRTLRLEDFAEVCASYFEKVKKAGLTCAGKIEIVDGTIGDYGDLKALAMANSEGLFVYSPSTWIDCSTTVFGKGGSGWSGNASHQISQVDVEKIFDVALSKALQNKTPKEIGAGRYPVILEPAAVRTLLGYLAGSFNAQTVVEDRSFITGKIGNTGFPKWFSLVDDAYHPSIGGASFDGEGTPVQKTTLIDQGKVRSLVTTRAIAKKLNQEPTGHGFYLPNPMGAFPSNLIASGGTRSLSEMIQSTEKAILVTRFWYTTPVDEKRLIISGMTRDGTFVVEKGKIVGSVKNFRFNQSIPEMFEKVEEAGQTTQCFGWLVPALKVRDFNFTSVALH